MYFVDREKIDQILVYTEKQLALLEVTNSWQSPIEKAALERICHTIVEGIIDVGNSMIDGFIMRDPGSYEDIIDILDDEKVVTKEMSISLKEIVAYRKMLVQEYISVDHEKLLKTFLAELASLKQFAPKVREYLVNELGPVSAFRN